MAIGNLISGTPKLITATTQIKTSDGVLLGIFCNASTSGTVTIYDDPATTGGKIVDTFTAVAATWYQLPMAFATGLRVVIGGTFSGTVVYV